MKPDMKSKTSDAKEPPLNGVVALQSAVSAASPAPPKRQRLGDDCDYKGELRRLQIELVKLQEWVRLEGLKVVTLFEGRDAAGKGGAIKHVALTEL